MKYSDSGSETAAESRPAQSSYRKSLRSSSRMVIHFVRRNAELGFYMFYAAMILAMLTAYFCRVPADRKEFYRRSFDYWKASVTFALHGNGRLGFSQTAAKPPAQIPAGQAVIGFIDQVNNKPSISLSDGDDAHVSGWAGCSDIGSPVAKVDILVAGSPKASAELSFPRPDVAAVFGRPDFETSGWKASFVARDLKTGTIPITARVTCADGKTGLLPAFQLIVTGRRTTAPPPPTPPRPSAAVPR